MVTSHDTKSWHSHHAQITDATGWWHEVHGDEKLFANASNSPSCENHPMVFGEPAGSWLHDHLRARRVIEVCKNRSEVSLCEGSGEMMKWIVFFLHQFYSINFSLHDWVLVAIRGQFHLQFPAMWGRGSVELPLLRSKLSGMVHEVIREFQITNEAER